MDNPWDNAWDNEADAPPSASWSSPTTTVTPHSVHNDQPVPESVWAPAHWAEPPEIAPAWGEESSFEDDGDNHVSDDTSDEQPVETTQEDAKSPVMSPPLPLSSPSPSPPPSPDAFGTFEIGLKLDSPGVDPWTPSQPSFAVSDSTSWEAETSWKSPRDEPDSGGTKSDEWEAAILQKEQQDRFVPPELLASILGNFQELSNDMWPSGSPELSENTVNRQAIEDIEELQASFRKFIPENLTIPPTIEFPKTFISKRLAESLKLTRHSPITRQSPFARYASSKGSTAWEASIKARPDSQLDLVPAGWRMVQKEEEVPISPTQTRPKPGGGLLSFFGRRTSTPPAEKALTSPTTRSASGSAPSSPRPSMDASRTSVSSIHPSVPSIPSPLSPTTPGPSSAAAAPALQPPVPILPPVREGTPPPSAVSRFLNRFSRTKSTSPRNSFALSSDDLEFLSDIVPSAGDHEQEDSIGGDSHEIRALAGMIGSSPLPTKLPPPLAPPPKAPPLPKMPQKSPVPTTDLSSFFDAQASLPSELPTVPQLPSFSTTSTPPSIPASFGDFSPTQMFPTTASRTITPVMKPLHSPALPPMSPFALPSPTIKNFAIGAGANGHQPAKRVPTAIMSTTTSRPPSTSQLQSAFTLPPPPASRERTPVLETAPPLVHNPIPRQPPQPSMSLFDDDDFSDFHAHIPSPSKPSAINGIDNFLSYADNSFTSVSSDQSLFSSTSSSDATKEAEEEFDDFDDFVSPPTMRTPSPPAPPAKSSSRQARPPKIELSTNIPINSPATSPMWQPSVPTRQARAADHKRTLTLMELTASRQWPVAPPSPLPPALPQPPGGLKKPFEMDIFGSTANTMQDQQMQAMAALPASVSSPAQFAPPPKTQFAPLQPAPLLNKVQTGGLSAQDLSFFEGL